MKFRMTSNEKLVAFMTIVMLSIWNMPLHADRILVIGDSWAAPFAPELQLVLHENGRTDFTVDDTPFIGQSWQMRTPEQLTAISAWLDERPDVSIVQITIGGNDWLGSGWTPFQAGTAAETNMIAGIIKNVEIVVDHILSLRPGIQILWSSYDFPRPVNIGKPPEVNAFIVRMTEQMEQFAMTRPNLSVVNLNGALQLAFGFDGVQRTAYDPGVVIPPGDNSLPDPGYPSPFAPFLPNDAWHLKSEGYKALAQVQYDEFYAPLLSGEGFHINAGLNDAWYNPATNGQGFLITVFPEVRQMFLAWFTFDTERPTEDVTGLLGDPGHRWLTAQGPYDGDTANLTIFVTKGGVFDSAAPSASTDPTGDGTLRLEFADCTEGMVTYAITSLGISGEIPIQRISASNLPSCESLDALGN
jgi:hypothetical protein